MSLGVETIRTRAGFEGLRDSWEALLAAEGEPSPFLSYDWFRCCLEDPEGAEPFVLAARDGARLVGIAPFGLGLIQVRWRRARAVGFIRCRETPHADFIASRGRRAEILDAMLEHLHAAERNAWDVLILAPWPETSENLGPVRDWLAARGIRRLERTASVVPVVAMGGDWNAFWEGRSYLFRKSRRGILNRMRRVEGVEVECHRTDPHGALVRTLFEVSEKGWKHAEGKAMTSREESKRFFAALTEAAGRRGWLLAWVLRANGSAIAIEYDLMADGIVHAIRADFDQAFGSYSPGAYLEYHILQRLFQEGGREYLAGPGADAYKLRWTEVERRNLAVSVFGRGGIGRLLEWTEGWAVPRMKRIRDILLRR